MGRTYFVLARAPPINAVDCRNGWHCQGTVQCVSGSYEKVRDRVQCPTRFGNA